MGRRERRIEPAWRRTPSATRYRRAHWPVSHSAASGPSPNEGRLGRSAALRSMRPCPLGRREPEPSRRDSSPDRRARDHRHRNAVGYSPPRNRNAATTNTATTRAMEPGRSAGAADVASSIASAHGTGDTPKCAPPLGMTSRSHPQRAFDDGAGLYAGTYLWVNDSVVEHRDCLAFGGLQPPLGRPIVFAVQGSHTVQLHFKCQY